MTAAGSAESGIRRWRSALILLLLLPLVLGCDAVSAETLPTHVTVRKLGAALFELTVTVGSEAELVGAQSEVEMEADKACANQPHELGPYSFERSNRIDAGAKSGGHLTVHQEVICGAVRKPRIAGRSYGWTPTSTDDQQVEARTLEYLAQKDRGDLAQAYRNFSEAMKETLHFDSWSVGVKAFNAKAGRVQERTTKKVSWVKDPAGVDPGFYAAVDYAGRYENVTHECGYVAWYREESGRLSIVREEEGHIDRVSEAKMTPDALRDALKEIRCVEGGGDNASAPARTPAALTEAEGNTIGYASVAAALQALRTKAGVTIRKENGWVIAEDRGEMTVWSFAPNGHPAYPTAVKRSIKTANGKTSIQMAVHCEADKVACDQVVLQFEQMNQHVAGAAGK